MKKVLLLSSIIILAACTVSYKFNGASIDYSKTKTLTIVDFRNVAPLVNPMLASQFNESLKDAYSQQTRLKSVKKNGDLQIEGEIVGYDLMPMSIQSNAVAAETRLTISVQVRFSNKTNPEKNFDKKFTAFRNFPSSSDLTKEQDQLCALIIAELVETIYNQTVADW